MTEAQEPRFFATPAAFRAWLKENHRTAKELLVGFHKRGSGAASITWPESVDEALCFGWIDGVRRSLGPDSYTIRFTPRRARSIWSAVNLRRIRALLDDGRVSPAGKAAYEGRDPKRSGLYSFEQRKEIKLDAASLRALKANAAAWTYFSAQAPWYQRTTAFWVMSAKKPETREKRLTTLIADSAAGRRIKGLDREKKA